MRPSISNCLSTALAAATLALGSGPVLAALVPGKASYSVVFSNLQFDLVDLDLTDNLVPQVTTTSEEFNDYFSGDLGYFKFVEGYIGPKTELRFNYQVDITLQVSDTYGSFVFFQYDAFAFNESVGIRDFDGGSWSFSSPNDGSYTGTTLQQTHTFQNSFSLANEFDGPIPAFAYYSLAAGPIFELSDDGISTIPEPSTYAMLLTGLALVGFSVRAKRQQQ